MGGFQVVSSSLTWACKETPGEQGGERVSGQSLESEVLSRSQCDTGLDLSWALDQSSDGKTTKPIRDQTRVQRVMQHTHTTKAKAALFIFTASQWELISAALNPFSTEPLEDFSWGQSAAHMHGCTHVNPTSVCTVAASYCREEVGAEI